MFFSIHSLSQLAHQIPIIVSCLFIVASAIYIFLYGKIHFDFTVLSLLLFLIFAILITVIISHDFNSLQTYITVITLSFFLYEFLFNDQKKGLVLVLYISSLILFFVVFVIYFLKTGQLVSYLKNPSEIRLGYFFDNPNAIGNSFLSGIVAALSYSIYKKKYAFSLISSLLFLMVIFMSGSRTAILSSLLTLIVYIHLIFFKNRKLICFAVDIFVLFLIIFIFSFPIFSGLKDRIVGIFNLFSGDKVERSAEGRFSMLITGIQFWSKYLFTGMGAGGFAFVSSHAGYSHATISEILCDFGLIGFVLFFIPQICCAFFSKKNSFMRKCFFLYLFGFVAIGMIGTVLLSRKCMYLYLAIVYAFFSSENKDTVSYVDFYFNRVKKISLHYKYNVGKTLLNLKNGIIRFKENGYE